MQGRSCCRYWQECHSTAARTAHSPVAEWAPAVLQAGVACTGRTAAAAPAGLPAAEAAGTAALLLQVHEGISNVQRALCILVSGVCHACGLPIQGARDGCYLQVMLHWERAEPYRKHART